MYNYDYFKDKFVEDLNLQELEWIFENGYMNNYPYWGRKLVLTENFQYDEIIKFYPKIIEMKNASYENIYDILDKYYLFISENFDKFISNDILVYQTSTIYKILNNAEKIFIGIVNNLEDFRTKMYSWRLWNIGPVVRSEEHIIDHPVSLPAFLAERGNYDEAIKILEERIVDKKGIIDAVMLLSVYFHLYRLYIKVGKQNKIYETLNYVKKYFDLNLYIFSRAHTELRLSEIILEFEYFLNHGEFTLDIYKNRLFRYFQKYLDISYLYRDNGITHCGDNTRWKQHRGPSKLYHNELFREPLIQFYIYYKRNKKKEA